MPKGRKLSQEGRLIRLVLDRFPTMNMLIRGGSSQVPYFIYNMDITEDQKLRARRKLKKIIDVQNPNSLFSYQGRIYFIADKDSTTRSLFCLFPKSGSISNVFDLPDRVDRVYYAGIEKFIYFGCRKFIYKLDTIDNTVLELDSVHSNSSRVLFDGIEDRHESELVQFPSADYLYNYQSRLIGAVGKRLVFSEPFLFDFTRPYNYIQLDHEITGIGSFENSILYVGTVYNTYIISKTLESPEIFRSDIGCMKNSMGVMWVMKGNVRIKVPAWMSQTSVVAGTPDGTIVPVTQGKIDAVFDLDSEGVPIAGDQNKSFMSAPHRNMQGHANAKFITTVVRNGKVIYEE